MQNETLYAAAPKHSVAQPSNTPERSMPAENALSVRHVERVFGGRRGIAATRALDSVSFDVQRGELVAIMGPSGSGKTTLLNCIATIDKPNAGSVAIGGKEVTNMSDRDLAKFRREELGFIFQDSNLMDTLTCFENIALPMTIGGVPASEIDLKVRNFSQRLGIGEVLSRYPYQVSGGQRQRVAACRALVTEPTLVLADEPTGSLDSKSAKLLLESFERLNAELRTTILMVTHDAFAASYCHRVLFIRDGAIFTEIYRGAQPRQNFFDQIMEIVAAIGGEQNDLH